MGENIWTGSITVWRNIVSRRVRYPIYMLWLPFVGVHNNQAIWLIFLFLKLQLELSYRCVKTSKELLPIQDDNSRTNCRSVPTLQLKGLHLLVLSISQSEPPVRPPEHNCTDNHHCPSHFTLTLKSWTEVRLPHPNHSDPWVTNSDHSYTRKSQFKDPLSLSSPF